MAEFLYFTGPMDCGKSTLALQFDYTYASSGRNGRLFTSQDRAGEATISSRLGLTRPAIEVTADFNFWEYAIGQLTGGQRIDYLVCDETQFYATEQIDQLARVVDELQIDVFAVGILTDFRTKMFPGSQRLVELCDRIDILQVRALCWCGQRATHNARTVNGVMVTEGEQVVIGDTTQPNAVRQVVAYEVLCRQHHRRKITHAIAKATLADPLPFGREDDPTPAELNFERHHSAVVYGEHYNPPGSLGPSVEPNDDADDDLADQDQDDREGQDQDDLETVTEPGVRL